jgi:hypothetical protein
MCRPGIEPGPPRWEASTLEKIHSNSLLMAIWNIYIRARHQWRNCATVPYIFYECILAFYYSILLFFILFYFILKAYVFHTFVLMCLQPTFPNWSVFNLKQSMKKLEPHGMELLEQVPFIVFYPTTSVADPGSGAFLTPGSEIQKKFFSRISHLGPRTQYFRELSNNVLG